MLPIFLGGVWVLQQKTTEHAFADVPLEECPAGSMKLVYGDGTTTGTGVVPQPSDPWAPAPNPNPNPAPAPAPINWDDYLDDEIIDRYNRNPRFRNVNEREVFENKLISRAFAQEEDWDGEGGQSFGGGPTCSSWANYMTSVAELACIVMQEQGGGPFCMAPGSNVIYNGLTDNSCRRVPGTQLAGFKIVATFPTYACGIPSPVTDG
ncbi:MAG: hypothetical protein AAB874_05285 [Patescibacteria group bacterium]